MKFGQKLRKLREVRGITQQELAEKLGYVTNSYIAEIEQGKYIPSEKKLREIAHALNFPFSEMKDLLLESKIEQLGIKEPQLIRLVRNIPKLSKDKKKRLIEVYLKIKEKKK